MGKKRKRSLSQVPVPPAAECADELHGGHELTRRERDESTLVRQERRLLRRHLEVAHQPRSVLVEGNVERALGGDNRLVLALGFFAEQMLGGGWNGDLTQASLPLFPR